MWIYDVTLNDFTHLDGPIESLFLLWVFEMKYKKESLTLSIRMQRSILTSVFSSGSIKLLVLSYKQVSVYKWLFS